MPLRQRMTTRLREDSPTESADQSRSGEPVPFQSAAYSDNLSEESRAKRAKLAQCNWFELIFAVCTGLIFIALHYVPYKIKNALYIVFVVVSFGSYIVYKIRHYGFQLIIQDWGLTCHRFGISFAWCTAVAFVGVVVMLIYMAVFETGLPFHYDLLLMLLLYPVWGCIQQFLIQAMIAINLSKANVNYYLVVLLTAISFTLVHWPEWLLMFATFMVGLTFTPIFLKYKCLYPLGIYHGWCGALLYWLVLDSDPMQRF